MRWYSYTPTHFWFGSMGHAASQTPERRGRGRTFEFRGELGDALVLPAPGRSRLRNGHGEDLGRRQRLRRKGRCGGELGLELVKEAVEGWAGRRRRRAPERSSSAARWGLRERAGSEDAEREDERDGERRKSQQRPHLGNNCPARPPNGAHGTAGLPLRG